MNKKSRLYLGIDIGGSNIKFAVVAAERYPRVVEKNHVRTPHDAKKIVRLAGEEKKKLEKKYGRFSVIGVAVAGARDMRASAVVGSPNLSYLNGFPLAAALTKELGVRIRLHNDANAFLFGEIMLGAARGSRRVFGITLGTGVGGAMVSHGTVEEGAHNDAGEIGHSIIEIGGRRCTCGGRGHAEEYLSTRAFLRLGGAFPDELAVLARKGNKTAKVVFDEIAVFLGAVFANIVNIYDPEIIVVGGGIAQEGDLFISKAWKFAVKDILSKEARVRVKIAHARLGQYAGAIGAALLAQTGQF